MTWEYDSSLWVDLGDRVREDDMNCGYCGCLLPDEYHPNCKQCGGPRKAARENRCLPSYTWFDYPAHEVARQAAEQEDAAWMDLAYYSKLTFAWGAEDSGE